MKNWMTLPKSLVGCLASIVLVFTFYGLSKAQRGLSPLQPETPLAVAPVDAGPRGDLDLVAVRDKAVPRETVVQWLNLLRAENDGSAVFAKGIANLEALLTSLTPPAQSVLLPNYPNPFNPETWIPYQLAHASEVKVSIYAANGSLVRMLDLGHRAPGVYQNKSRAAYWDGRNAAGERVASGVYFYTVEAGTFRATRKMLIVK